MFAPTLVYRDRYPRYFSFFFLTLIRWQI
jgi:hypothetical protein